MSPPVHSARPGHTLRSRFVRVVQGLLLAVLLIPLARASGTAPAEIEALRRNQDRPAAALRADAVELREASTDRTYRAWAALAVAEFENDLENADPALELIEEALREAEALALDDLRFEALVRKSTVLVNRGRSKETEAVLVEMKRMVDASKRRDWQAQWLHECGVLERKLGRFERARALFLQAREVLRELGDDGGVARELNSIGMLDGRTGRFSDAVAMHNEALTLARSAADQGEIARSLRMLGVLYRNLDDEELASRYLLEALDFVEERNRREAIALHGELSGSFTRLERITEAEYHAQRSVELAEISGSPPNKVNSFTRMAELRLIQNRLPEAERWVERAFESFDAVAVRDQVLLRLTRIKVQAIRGSSPEILTEAEAVLAETRRIGDRILERGALDLLSEQQLRAGDAASAFITRKAHQALDKELAIDVAARRIAVLESSLEREREAAERELLERDNAIQALTLNRQRLFGIALIAGLFALVAVAGLFYSRYRNADRRRREISQSRDELARLHQALVDSATELERVAHTDALTGLSNRHAIVDELARRLRDPTRALAVMLLDLDHFKQINDQHGHLAGDAVLREVATRLRTALPAAAVGRWGGEEFIAVLDTSDPVQTLAIAEGARTLIAATPVRFEGRDLAISASIGIASRRPGEAMDGVLGNADAALYRAKRAGRNRVEPASA
jgi:diguanylate cyclase (GGDEF)-like protein